MRNSKLRLYLFILFLISYLAQIITIMIDGIDGELFSYMAPIIMFLPGILALVFLKFEKKLNFIDWKPKKPKFLILAVFITAFAAILNITIIEMAGLGELTHLSFNNASVTVIKGLFVLGKGEQSIYFFILNAILTVLVLSSISGIFAAGEELGWRGYVQKSLLSMNSFHKTCIIVGFVWAHWHTPIILAGYNYPETPILGALLLWPAYCIGFSYFVGWLTVKAGNFWPAALAHGAMNSFHGGLVDNMLFYNNKLIPDLIGIAIWFLIALICIKLSPFKDQENKLLNEKLSDA